MPGAPQRVRGRRCHALLRVSNTRGTLRAGVLRIVCPLLLPQAMARSMRNLLIAAFAVLAFLASNFAMVSSTMAHGMTSGHHGAVAVCNADHSHESGAPEPCKAVPKGTCEAGPTCCSSACNALILANAFSSFHGAIEVPEAARSFADAVNPVVLLERPPRQLALS